MTGGESSVHNLHTECILKINVSSLRYRKESKDWWIEIIPQMTNPALSWSKKPLTLGIVSFPTIFHILVLILNRSLNKPVVTWLWRVRKNRADK